MMRACWWGVAGFLVSVQAPAATTPGSAIDLFYVANADFEISDGIDSVSIDGDGFGIQGRFKVSESVALGAEYQQVDMDDVPIEITQIRLRVAGSVQLSTGVNLTLEGGYIDADIDFGLGFPSAEGNGPMGHLGVEFRPSRAVTLFGKAGWVKIEDSDGPEFHVGARAKVSDALGILADYRMTSLEESGEDLELDDLRVGVSFLF